ncbi:unnamed protein product [Haemonchus placei]|uniref:DUF4113 domain-containing protein n=1 Tax=Haemonchus placei TaxID=6290 RepID=A0A0N4VVJ8_HAEPC|nr:unnamed protein product [Haemonchus placei]
MRCCRMVKVERQGRDQSDRTMSYQQQIGQTAFDRVNSQWQLKFQRQGRDSAEVKGCENCVSPAVEYNIYI